MIEVYLFLLSSINGASTGSSHMTRLLFHGRGIIPFLKRRRFMVILHILLFLSTNGWIRSRDSMRKIKHFPTESYSCQNNPIISSSIVSGETNSRHFATTTNSRHFPESQSEESVEWSLQKVSLSSPFATMSRHTHEMDSVLILKSSNMRERRS